MGFAFGFVWFGWDKASVCGPGYTGIPTVD